MSLSDLKNILSKERLAINELASLINKLDTANSSEKAMISSHIDSLKKSLKKLSKEVTQSLGQIQLNKPLPLAKVSPPVKKPNFPISEKRNIPQRIKTKDIGDLEFETLRRIKRGEKKIIRKKQKKPSFYVKFSNKLFSNYSISLLEKGYFRRVKADLVKANLQFLAKSYISVIFLTTAWSFLIGLFLMFFFLFFSIGPTLPIVTMMNESLSIRFLKVFWLPIVVPVLTFLAMSVYPSLEKKSLGGKIDQELPFAAIHMSAISGSMIDPSKIFNILVSTKEYPSLEKQFVKLINEMSIFGYDFVTALRNIGFNSPSKKLSELLNGLATTITSGGDLPEFFEKRAQTLLFDYRLEREKYIKSAETFMDIYISVVIAAPMILMLLLMMMKISGLGISISTQMITLIMILGVGMVNVIFLTFLHLKQPSG